MLIALYEMTAKSGREEDFEQAWAELTDAIYQVRGSLGSRLHRTETPGLYIAYAQWPSRAVYESTDSHLFSAAQLASGERMRDALESSRTLHLMDVCDDRLRSVVRGPPPPK